MNPLKKQPNKPRIVAVSGAIAAGKDTLANYLVQRHQVVAIEVGAFARQLSDETAVTKPSYDPAVKRLASLGAEYLMQRIVSEIVRGNEWRAEAFVVTGVRTPAEAFVLKERFGADILLTSVRVGDQNVRYERFLQRHVDVTPVTLQEFARQDTQMKSESALTETQKLADLTLWNNGLLEAFYQQIETNLVPYLFPVRGSSAAHDDLMD